MSLFSLVTAATLGRARRSKRPLRNERRKKKILWNSTKLNVQREKKFFFHSEYNDDKNKQKIE
jgi:hypothetical protein